MAHRDWLLSQSWTLHTANRLRIRTTILLVLLQLQRTNKRLCHEGLIHVTSTCAPISPPSKLASNSPCLFPYRTFSFSSLSWLGRSITEKLYGRSCRHCCLGINLVCQHPHTRARNPQQIPTTKLRIAYRALDYAYRIRSIQTSASIPILLQRAFWLASD